MRPDDKLGARLTWLLLGAIIGVIIATLAFVFNDRASPEAINISPRQAIQASEPTANLEATATPGPLHVYISGEVVSPAVYEFVAGSLVQDAVNQAGGFTAAADATALNLAQGLADGMHIHIPAQGDPAAAGSISLPPIAATSNPTTGAGIVININTASLEELDTLPGIGPSIAQNLLDYRQTNGPFTAIEEVMDVNGIGPAKFEQIKELITVR